MHGAAHACLFMTACIAAEHPTCPPPAGAHWIAPVNQPRVPTCPREAGMKRFGQTVRSDQHAGMINFIQRACETGTRPG